MAHKIYRSNFWESRIRVIRDRGINPLTAIDIGSHFGQWYKEFTEIFPNCKTLSVDANPELEGIMREANPNFILALMGAEMKDETEFYISSANSLDPGSSIYKEATKWGLLSRPAKMPMITLDSLDSKFDWIKIDVQGAELDVLKGGSKTLEKATIVELELSFMRFNQGAPLAAEVISWMSNQGYEMLDITEHMYIEEEGDGLHKAIQFNALFINGAYSHLLEIKG